MAFQSLNHTLLYAVQDTEMSFIYSSIPDLVSTLLVESNILEACLNRNDMNYLDYAHDISFPPDFMHPGRHGCVKRPGYEEGIPIWKMFAWFWWEGGIHPLGNRWTLGPEDWASFKGGKGNNYLGQSIFLDNDNC